MEQVSRILPSVSDLNNQLKGDDFCPGEKDNLVDAVHFAWVESEHPYKPSTVAHYRYVISF